MTDSTQRLLLAIWDHFPVALSSSGILIAASLISRALRLARKHNEELTIEKVPMLLWLSPVYLWGLETIYGVFMIFSASAHGTYPLGLYQRLLFTNLYCLLLVVGGVLASLLILHGKSATRFLRNPLGRSLYMSVGGVLVLEVVLFVLAFRFM